MNIYLYQPWVYKKALLNLLKLFQLRGLPSESVDDLKIVYQLIELIDQHMEEEDSV